MLAPSGAVVSLVMASALDLNAIETSVPEVPLFVSVTLFPAPAAPPTRKTVVNESAPPTLDT